MPIEYRILHHLRLVAARGVGMLSAEDLFDYQREVCSQPELAGYNELVDMTQTKGIVSPSPDRMRELAALSASMDTPPTWTRFAIVAPQDLAFALGELYEAYRRLEPRSTKDVAVFRTMAEALTFLGIEGKLELWADAKADASN
ncbi:MAG: hypothetical protein L0209_06375 [candidate division Zixibacteria bacterium]|nr:hypothetical protein [candidate division Zixibacteria bacterium]